MPDKVAEDEPIAISKKAYEFNTFNVIVDTHLV